MKWKTAMTWIVFSLALCLVPCLVTAEEEKPLYAVKDKNGLWGYIDCKGNLVIPGIFTYAEDFRGDYALVQMIPEEEPETDYGYFGIIDMSGQWVLPAEYGDILSCSDSGDYAGGQNTGVYLVVNEWNEDSKQGFFDIPSGFFFRADL